MSNVKLGAEPKKLIILGGLILFLVVYLLWPSGNSGSTTVRPASSATPARPTAPQADISRSAPVRPRNSQQRPAENRPNMKPRRQGEGPDPTTVDPTLRLDLLARLQQVPPASADRSLFEFGAAAAPTPPPLAQPEVPRIRPGQAMVAKTPFGPEKAPPPPPPPPPPQAPPAPFKFYGFSNNPRQGAKRAFFLNGEDILVATEGEVILRKYKIVRIGVNSVVVRDLDFNQDQTLPLEQEQVG
jgi:hypothetical protein